MKPTEAFKDCPQFQRCSVNQCPLDELMLQRPSIEADREQKCHANRSTRVAIAARYADLPTGGLTLKEIARDKRRAAARERWDALPAEERAKRTAHLVHK